MHEIKKRLTKKKSFNTLFPVKSSQFSLVASVWTVTEWNKTSKHISFKHQAWDKVNCSTGTKHENEEQYDTNIV